MQDQLDGRAGFGLGSALASLLVFINPGAGIFFGLVGAVFAVASIISTDNPPTPRTRRIALIAAVISVAAFTIGLNGAVAGPQG
jgi:hypothetical protein